jgi:hypothetical protein
MVAAAAKHPGPL